MTIPAAKVMELRNLTGAGMMDCKRALQETDGDMEQAQDYLRKKGISIAAKKSDRETNEGGVGITFSDDLKSAAMVRLACETDFVARNEQFDELLGKLGQQVLASGDENVPDQDHRRKPHGHCWQQYAWPRPAPVLPNFLMPCR